MGDRHRRPGAGVNPAGGFETTRWTMVLQAGDPSTPQHREALESLFQTYWYPLYAYLRRTGCSAEESEDLVQGFLAHVFEKRALRLANPDRGRFRSFLLASLKNYAANERKRAGAQKRGGRAPHLSLDFAEADRQYANEPTDSSTPERQFERSWAMTVLEGAIGRLEAKLEASGKQESFEVLREFLVKGDSNVGYRDAARRLGNPEMVERGRAR
jgi:RNA polymerase sigma-70 factor (ECF subfamily)